MSAAEKVSGYSKPIKGRVEESANVVGASATNVSAKPEFQEVAGTEFISSGANAVVADISEHIAVAPVKTLADAQNRAIEAADQSRADHYTNVLKDLDAKSAHTGRVVRSATRVAEATDRSNAVFPTEAISHLTYDFNTGLWLDGEPV